MSSKVVIKFYKNGVRLLLDDSASFEDIIAEIEQKFTSGSSFFGDAELALQIDGRELSVKEEIDVVNAIVNSCELKIKCIVSSDEQTNHHYVKALAAVKEKLRTDDKFRLIKGSITDRQIVESDEGLVILGDVNPGCTIISKGNVIVFGGLYGIAKAGYGNSEAGDSFVIALEMAAEVISVGPINYIPSVKPKWGIKHKIKPEIAFAKGENIAFEPVSRSVLESLYETV